MPEVEPAEQPDAAVERERLIFVPSLFNLRDLGGYSAADGRRLRWRRLYRADGLQRLAEPERRQLAALGIRTVVDLRRPEEVAVQRFTADGIDYHHHSVQPAPWDAATYDEEVGTARFLADRYLEMACENGDEVGAVLRLIADVDATPLVFHCAAGKDRTGVVAALTLSLLGVSDDDVARDYGLSAETIPRWTEWALVNRPSLAAEVATYPAPWHDAPPEAILAFLADLRAEHGSVASYVGSVGVDRATVERMRAHLLEAGSGADGPA